MAKEYYALYLDDPAKPGFCSCDKLYIGTENELRTVVKRMKKAGNYEGSVLAFKSYFEGNTKAMHNVAYKDITVLEHVKFICSSELSLKEKKWTHINIWNCPYNMKVDSASIQQIIVKHRGKYYRCIRAWLDNLCYEMMPGKWSELKDGFWGHKCLMDVKETSENDFVVNNLLYVVEDSYKSLDELDNLILDPDKIIFDRICDEIFADG